MHDKQVQLRLRKKKPLALWLAAISAQAIMSPEPVAATDLPVVLTATTSCDDDGSPGTLRYAVLTASDGDTIDLSALTCSHITLQTGAINVDQNSLTIVGAGAAELSIDANHAGRAFFHSGSGTLSLDEMTVSDGLYTAPRAMGGCIYSKGSVALNHMIVSGCEARGTTAASGGGVLATYDLSLVRSTLSGNVAHATVGAVGTAAAAGGGAAALHHLTLSYSLVSGNSAHAAAGTVHGGGLYVVKSFNGKYSTINANTATVDYFLINGSSALAGGLSFGYNGHATSFLMQSCTIDHNRADAAAGLILDGDITDTSSIRNSTISTNIANFEGGGVAVATRLTLSNSTIAFNSTGVYGGGGMIAVGDKMTLESSIIADNSPNGTVFAADLDGPAVISGHDNLVKIIGSSVVLPSGTIRLDPQLGALKDNGGVTRTHALLPGSPAIDTGNNSANLSTDQRNSGFPRVIGAAPDIGAFEFNSDIIFINGFN